MNSTSGLSKEDCALSFKSLALRQSVVFLVIYCTHISKPILCVVISRGYKTLPPLKFWCYSAAFFSLSSVFLSSSFPGHYRQLCLPPSRSCNRLSSCLRLPTEAAHKELASIDGKETRSLEYIFAAQPERQLAPPFSLPQSTSILVSVPLSPSQSLSISLKCSQYMIFNKNSHTHLAWPTKAVFWLFTEKLHKHAKSSCETKREEMCEGQKCCRLGGKKKLQLIHFGTRTKLHNLKPK